MSKKDGASCTVTILTSGVNLLSNAETPETKVGLISSVGLTFFFGTGMNL